MCESTTGVVFHWFYKAFMPAGTLDDLIHACLLCGLAVVCQHDMLRISPALV